MLSLLLGHIDRSITQQQERAISYSKYSIVQLYHHAARHLSLDHLLYTHLGKQYKGTSDDYE